MAYKSSEVIGVRLHDLKDDIYNTVQPFGINQEVNIDFNGDGQIDWQLDHDRVD